MKRNTKEVAGAKPVQVKTKRLRDPGRIHSLMIPDALYKHCAAQAAEMGLTFSAWARWVMITECVKDKIIKGKKNAPVQSGL